MLLSIHMCIFFGDVIFLYINKYTRYIYYISGIIRGMPHIAIILIRVNNNFSTVPVTGRATNINVRYTYM